MECTSAPPGRANSLSDTSRNREALQMVGRKEGRKGQSRRRRRKRAGEVAKRGLQFRFGGSRTSVRVVMCHSFHMQMLWEKYLASRSFSLLVSGQNSATLNLHTGPAANHKTHPPHVPGRLFSPGGEGLAEKKPFLVLIPFPVASIFSGAKIDHRICALGGEAKPKELFLCRCISVHTATRCPGCSRERTPSPRCPGRCI